MKWALLILLGIGSFMIFQNFKSPELGVQNGQFKPLGSRPNSVSTQTKSISKKVEPIAFNSDLKSQMASVESIISDMPGASIKQKESDYLYAVFTTPLLRFKDDVEIYLDGNKKELHFRSASRVGYSDLGVNRKRYEAFSSKLNP